MRVAVSYDNGNVFEHFGHTEHFKLYDVKDAAVTGTMVVEALGCGHEALAELLSGMHVGAVICGGIGGGARAALEQAGILLYGGVSGSADDVVKALLSGTLRYDPDIHCRAHGENGEHTCGHVCGEHPSCAGCHGG